MGAGGIESYALETFLFCAEVFSFSAIQLLAERDRLNSDLEALHAEIRAAQSELETMYRGTAVRRG